MTEPMIDLLENKIKTLRNILGGDEPSRFPEAEKLAAEVVRLYDVGFCLPSGLQPLPLIINYTVELMDRTDKINQLITNNQ